MVCSDLWLREVYTLVLYCCSSIWTLLVIWGGSDLDIMFHFSISKSKLVICTLSDLNSQPSFISHMRNFNKSCISLSLQGDNSLVSLWFLVVFLTFFILENKMARPYLENDVFIRFFCLFTVWYVYDYDTFIIKMPCKNSVYQFKYLGIKKLSGRDGICYNHTLIWHIYKTKSLLCHKVSILINLEVKH